MLKNKSEVVKPHDFSTAFERMCSVVAIGKTVSVEETIRELILHCLFHLPDDEFKDASDIEKAILGLFGLNLSNQEIESSLSTLINHKSIHKNSGILTLDLNLRNQLEKIVNDAYELEDLVREAWKNELEENYPLLDSSFLWNALRKYLAIAFQRHGIQTVALLDPRIEITSQYANSLSNILYDAVSDVFQEEERSKAIKAISDFMASTGNNPERSKYITQLADGAFTYFTLTIDPEVATNFRKELKTVLLFLDTNFLYGILDIEVHPQVAVSKELLEAIKKFNIPFKLYTHPKTIEELLFSIHNYEQELKNKQWSLSISKAAYDSRSLSGIELRYHQRFADEGIDVDSFFAPYRHADVLLKQMGVKTYPIEDERIEERATLYDDYTLFLEGRNLYKPYKLIDHDMTVLDLVRKLRTNAPSTLEAGALLVTRDYSLYRFDWETSRKNDTKPSTVLPNILWQIIRQFIPAKEDFDRSFAETFAIPEFRIIGSRSTEACSRMLNILAGYKNFPEETARRMLSNDILIQHLQTAENDETFQQFVEAAIVDENEILLEEKEQVETKWVEEKHKRKEVEEKIESEVEARRISEQNAQDSNQQLMREREIYSKKLENSEKKIKELSGDKDKFKSIISWGGAILVSLVLILFFEILVNILAPWPWLVNHKNSILLHIMFISLITCFVHLIIINKYRKDLLFSLIVPIIFFLLGIFIN
jgi:hypothetical protein